MKPGATKLDHVLAGSARECRIVARCLLAPLEAPLSKLGFLAGLAYLFAPIDLIPSRLPYVGHLDEVGFVLAGLLAARLFAPASMLRFDRGPAEPAGPSLRDAAVFAVRVLRADLANFLLVRYRSIDGFLITGKNSGTHWLKFMLSVAIARQHQVAPPAHASGAASNTIIGHPSRLPPDPALPRIGSSHTIPSIAFASRFRLFDHPPVVVLVRDIREALASNYVKWRDRYDCPFTEYLHGDPSGRRFVADVWWYVHFFNRWGDAARARPGNTLIVHYEDVQAAPEYWLRRIGEHLRLDLGEPALQAALAYAARAAVAARLDPAFGEVIIPDAADRRGIAFSPGDAALLDGILRRHLRHSLGYAHPVRGAPTPPGFGVAAASGELAS